ncbi:MAG: Clavaminate synthase [Lasallia pustulata]|uniref:Clavaminate synthase n=1 Tax=Lasallia pustulata TaxID=136370 RepID=A0A5M8PHN3_9LECA|nr:MAG: Clavaminate synthase [Lasallia pustulata]
MAPSATSPTLPPTTTPANSYIPLIDFSPLVTGTPAEKLATANSILHAFETSGFLYLHSHPIPPAVLTSVFSHSAAFFARPQAQKDSLPWTSARANRGYTAQGREKVSSLTSKEEVDKLREGTPDLKESIEIGREGDEGCPNRWPDFDGDEQGAEFKLVMQEFFLKCKDLHCLIMRAIALGMGLDEDFFDSYTRTGDNTLRLLHYPAVRKSVFEQSNQQMRAGEHSDYGSITLLFQDQRGGLQVMTPSGKFVDATPIEGTVVVNAGDLLMRWSNDLVKSTKHRVVEPPPVLKGEGEEAQEQFYPARYSVAYFCNPDFDRWIEALPGTWEGEKGGKKYEAINSGEYLVQRLSATY